MQPHKCRHCGKVITTKYEKEAHVEERIKKTGCDTVVVKVSDSEKAYEARRDELRRKSWDRKKMDERLKEERDMHAPLTFNPFGALLIAR